MCEYNYASGDLIKNPNSYFYSNFYGEKFLDAWRIHREGVIQSLAVAFDEDRTRFFNFQQRDLNALTLNYEKTKKVCTMDLLNAIGNALEKNSGPLSVEVSLWLDHLVKKFETTKKIHEAYGKNFLAIDKSQHNNIELYLLLAEVFVVAYEKDANLIYLNVSLKINDTLCSKSEILKDDQKKRLMLILELEKKNIIYLYGKLRGEM